MEKNKLTYLKITYIINTANLTMRKTKRSYYLGCIIALLLTMNGFSQESLMPEVNPVYLQKLVDTAKKYSPRVQTYDHRANIAVQNIRKARLAWFDLFTFSYLYSPNNSTTLVNPSVLNGYQFGVFFNFSSLFTKGPNIRQAKEELVISKLEKQEYSRNLEAEVRARYYRYVQAQVILKVRKQAELDAENIMKQTQHKFEKSEDSYENFNKFSVAYADRRQAAIESEGNVLITKAALEEMVGKKLEEIN